jgi:hypothetical protein
MLAELARVRDWRVSQIGKLANVEVFLDSELDEEQILEFGADRVALATGARWRKNGIGRWHLAPRRVLEAARPSPSHLRFFVQGDHDRHALFEAAHPRAVGRVGREKFKGLTASGFRHVLPERDALARIEARCSHQIQTEQVSLALLCATPAKQDADLGARAQQSNQLAVHRIRRVGEHGSGLHC